MTDVTTSSGNVFADLGLPDADEHLFKARIVAIITASIRARDLTQTAAAKRMKLAQPDVSKLLNGRFENFSIERLFACLRALGHDLDLTVTAANENAEPGRLRLACSSV